MSYLILSDLLKLLRLINKHEKKLLTKYFQDKLLLHLELILNKLLSIFFKLLLKEKDNTACIGKAII